jgi:hypothetical protein
LGGGRDGGRGGVKLSTTEAEQKGRGRKQKLAVNKVINYNVPTYIQREKYLESESITYVRLNCIFCVKVCENFQLLGTTLAFTVGQK